MSDNIKVAIKVRPLIKREKDDDLPIQWTVEGNNISPLDSEIRKKGETEFSFDYIFDQGSTNQDVFESTVKPIVESAMRGFNGTIFAYGQTSSGKTYTMMGTPTEPGVIPLAVSSIFDCIKKDQTREFVLSVSYLEIYNEKINDLLDTEKRDLKIREDPNGEVKVECKEEVTHSVEDIMQVMRKGEKNRRIGETNMNERSSRSHTIFKITIGSVLKTDADGVAMVSHLNLIDLAGSERARQTGATGERFNEGRHINLSLSTLGLVIKQLSEHHKHISYRDSKLTRILQPSLGGNSLTTIICAVTPVAGDETMCTLAFAQRAKGIKNKPIINETGSDEALVKKFRKQIHKLQENLRNVTDELKEKNEKLQDVEVLKIRIELLQKQILSGNSADQNSSMMKTQANRRRTWAGHCTNPSTNYDFTLPTIQECELPLPEEDDKKAYIKRRQSVFKTINESFSTEWEDFELQLIKDEEERRTRWSSDSTDGERDSVYSNCRSVTFRNEDDWREVDNPKHSTPQKKKFNSDNLSPGTPKSALRQTIRILDSNLQELREYTTLEKQLRQNNSPERESQLAFVQKSLNDTEQICRDLNKQYSELQSEHSILKSEYQASTTECENLRKQVKSLTLATENIPILETENKNYKTKLNETLSKLKTLEDETSSHAYAMESIINKHKAREKELETSLNAAWDELNKYKENDKNTVAGEKEEEIHRLQSVVDELNEKLNLLDEKLELSNSEIKQLKDKENQVISEYSAKIKSYEELIAEKDIQLSQSSELSLKYSEIEKSLKDNEQIIENMKTAVSQMEATITAKDAEIAKLNSHIQELTSELETSKVNYAKSLEEQQQQMLNSLNTEMNKSKEEIERLEKIIEEKSTELALLSESSAKRIQDLENEKEQLVNDIKNQEDLKTQIFELQKSLQETRDSLNAVDAEKKQLLSELDCLKMKKPSDTCRQNDTIVSQTSKMNISNRRSVNDKESSSIFANASYFNSSCMDTSACLTDSVFANSAFNSSEITSITDVDQSIMKENQSINIEEKTPTELSAIIKTLESENKKLLQELHLKIRETEDIKNDIHGFKSELENLQQTVLLLTTENAELATKLAQEKDYSGELKASFEKQLTCVLQEKQDIVKNSNTNRSIIENGEDTVLSIDSLTQENNQLSEKLMEKIEELEMLRKDLEAQVEKSKVLEKENIDLSNDLMEKIEEYEAVIKKLRDQNESLIKDLSKISNRCDSSSCDKATETIKIEEDSCKKCGHLKELILTRRALKNDLKSADQKLHDLKEKFEKKSADAEKLQTKVKEELNISCVLNDSIFNGSFCESYDGTDVASYVDEKIQKLYTELEALRTDYEKLTARYDEKCSEIENLRDGSQSPSKSRIEKLSEELNEHRDDLYEFKKYINGVSNALQKFKAEKIIVVAELEDVKKEKEHLEKKLQEEQIAFATSSQSVQEQIKSLQEKMEILQGKSEICNNENQRLSEIKENLEKEIESLKSVCESYEKKSTSDNSDNDKNNNFAELEAARAYIKKEIVALKPKANLEGSDTVSDLFRLFMETIMKKEKEIIQEKVRKETEKLEEEKRQCIDAEKRASIWSKELETDIERLESETETQKSKIAALQDEIFKLNNSLKECQHEKELMNDKMSVMETDFATLQADLEKYTKAQSPNESKILISQEEMDKIISETLKNSKIEHSSKINELEERHRASIEELTNSVESMKTKNLDLKNTIEGLKANETNLKSIIDLKVAELGKSTSAVERLEQELKELTDSYNSLTKDREEDRRKIEEITELLKRKCDKLSEYKTQLETMKPEYEMLKDQSVENQRRLDKYRSEVEALREENSTLTRSITELKDRFNTEEIKNCGLSKQIADLLNKNTALQGEFDKLRDMYDVLESEKDSLIRKMRNSTSKLTMERELEELRDEIKTLEKNLEGAGNRITELQAAKTQLTSENTELEGKCKSLQQTNLEVNNTLNSYKVKISTLNSSLAECEDRNATLTQEVQKMTARLGELETKVASLLAENDELKSKNQELDAENEELVKRWEDLDVEYGILETKLFEYEKNRPYKQDNKTASSAENSSSNRSEIDSLKREYNEAKRELEHLTIKWDTLVKENSELRSKLKEYGAESNSSQSKSTNSSRSNSPTPTVSRRKQRRSEIFNQNRPDELAQELIVAEDTVCSNCDSLRRKINELEHEIVLKKGKVTALEMKIEGIVLPYKKQSQDFKERLEQSRMKVVELQNEIIQLQENQRRFTNCERCKHWRDNRRDQCQQTMPVPEVLRGFGTTKTGIVEDQRKIDKLEKDKVQLIKMCSDRCKEIKKLSKRISELEDKLQLAQNSPTLVQLADSGPREESKENVPDNFVGQSNLIPSLQSSRFNNK